MPSTGGAVKKIRKRDGRVVDFEQEKITNAIHKAIMAVDAGDGEKARRISDDVVKTLNDRFRERIPSVEDIQNIVVEVLKKEGYVRVYEEYQSYRERKAEIRRMKKELGISEEPKLTVNALEVLRKRYLLKNNRGEIVERPSQMFRRVAKAIASADTFYDEDEEEAEEEFFRIMSRLEFLPNSPTLFNAGTRTDFALSACYVLPVEDSLEGIFTSLKNMALIEQTGGGVGFNFSRLRPAGDLVRSTMGVASGPVSFMRIFDVATDVIKAGGRRRGAMMAILRVDHPDIFEFITAKSRTGVLTNFNISVAITDDFMEALEKDGYYSLVNPRTGETVKRVGAKQVWDLIAENAWKSGDPGVVFIDEINRHNPTPSIGTMEATNPCGEQPLLPYESCNLGSINLSRMVNEDNMFDWEKFKKTIHTAVHFLDNVIDVNPYPIKEIEEVTKANRKIGLGVMGFAELLIRLGMKYDSHEAVGFGEKIAKFLNEEAVKASEELAEKRGCFPNFWRSIWARTSRGRRNATVTTIAPTGTISIIAGCSSGIEPLFAVAFMRHVLEGERLFELNPLFERMAKDRGFYNGELLEKIVRAGSIGGLSEIPEDVRSIFVTAHEVSPEWHVRMQAAFQKHTENAVSKTVNLPNNSSVSDVEKVFRLAYDLKCKGVTVYRYGSKGEQVLNIGPDLEGEFVTAEAEYAGGAPTLNCQICG
ncbi:MAG: adenosylcobalamin-dependent ribonucleoside-diphosphate reductase [Candidatus Bathyarchaeia archaeon]